MFLIEEIGIIVHNHILATFTIDIIVDNNDDDEPFEIIIATTTTTTSSSWFFSLGEVSKLVVHATRTSSFASAW